MVERTNEVFEGVVRVTAVGSKLTPGTPAPDFLLEYLDPADGAIHTATLADSAGKVRLLNVINSLDTPVCHIETHRWEGLRADLPADVVVYTVSMDLPYAQARWHAQEEVQHQSLSAHQSEQFGQDYGVLIKEWRLLQRSVFVIDRHDRLVYADYVADQMAEPAYAPALEAARQAAS